MRSAWWEEEALVGRDSWLRDSDRYCICFLSAGVGGSLVYCSLARFTFA